MAFKAPAIDWSKIENLIFDFGDVIINIDFDLTFQAFADLMGCSLQESKARFEQHQLWETYETGKWTNQEFLAQLREKLGLTNSDEELIHAWNAILLDIPAERIKKLKKLRKKYKLSILSNTSDLHVTEANNILFKSHGIKDIRHLFDYSFLSQEMGCRKPGEEIYQKVLVTGNMDPFKTVFLDDNEANIKGASRLGIYGLQVTKTGSMIDLLENA